MNIHTTKQTTKKGNIQNQIRDNLTSNYTQVSNDHIRDPELSLKAKGLLAILCSHDSSFNLTERNISAFSKDGRDATRSALQELQDAGYLERTRARAEDGTLEGTIYTIKDPGSQGRKIQHRKTRLRKTQPYKKNISKKENIKEVSPAFSEQAKEIADALLQAIKTNNPTHRYSRNEPNTEAWATDIDKAIRIDKRNPADLTELINFIFTTPGPISTFWAPNIASGKKLREKYDQIQGQRKRNLDTGRRKSDHSQTNTQALNLFNQ